MLHPAVTAALRLHHGRNPAMSKPFVEMTRDELLNWLHYIAPRGEHGELPDPPDEWAAAFRKVMANAQIP